MPSLKVIQIDCLNVSVPVFAIAHEMEAQTTILALACSIHIIRGDDLSVKGNLFNDLTDVVKTANKVVHFGHELFRRILTLCVLRDLLLDVGHKSLDDLSCLVLDVRNRPIGVLQTLTTCRNIQVTDIEIKDDSTIEEVLNLRIRIATSDELQCASINRVSNVAHDCHRTMIFPIIIKSPASTYGNRLGKNLVILLLVHADDVRTNLEESEVTLDSTSKVVGILAPNRDNDLYPIFLASVLR